MCSRGVCVPRVQLKIISWSTGQKKHNCFFILFFYIGHFNMCVHTCVLSQILLERVCVCVCVRTDGILTWLADFLQPTVKQWLTDSSLPLILFLTNLNFFSSVSFPVPLLNFYHFSTFLSSSLCFTALLLFLSTGWVLTTADCRTEVLFLPLLCLFPDYASFKTSKLQ